MAKIDTSKIEGYAEMSAEEKLKALEGFEMPDPDYSNYVTKETANKWSSEAADYKKKYKELLSEEQRKQEEHNESVESMRKELDQLKAEKALNEHVSSLIALGYSSELANKVAKATVDGDFKKVYELQSKFIEDTKKTVESEALKKTPAPEVGDDGDKTVTAEKFKSMTLAEKQKLYEESPDTFNEYFKE